MTNPLESFLAGKTLTDGEVDQALASVEQAIDTLNTMVQWQVADQNNMPIALQHKRDELTKLKASRANYRLELPAEFMISFKTDRVDFLGLDCGPWTVPNSDESEALWEALVALYAKTTGRGS